MPALRALDAPARAQLAEAAHALVLADHQTTLAEHAVLQMLRWGLAEPPRGRALGAEIARASDVLFAALAHAGAPDPASRAAAHRAGRARLAAALRVPEPTGAPPADPFDSLDAALGTLRRATEPQRHGILDAAHAVVLADGRTLREEARWLRAMALALGVACVVRPSESVEPRRVPAEATVAA